MMERRNLCTACWHTERSGSTTILHYVKRALCKLDNRMARGIKWMHKAFKHNPWVTYLIGNLLLSWVVAPISKWHSLTVGTLIAK